MHSVEVLTHSPTATYCLPSILVLYQPGSTNQSSTIRTADMPTEYSVH